MVQKSQGQPPFGCIKNGKEWDKLPTSTGYIAGFLNHQQYQLVHSISFSHHPSKGFIQPISLAGMFRKTQTFTSESPLGPTSFFDFWTPPTGPQTGLSTQNSLDFTKRWCFRLPPNDGSSAHVSLVVVWGPVVWSPIGSPYFQGDLGFQSGYPKLESQTTWVPTYH